MKDKNFLKKYIIVASIVLAYIAISVTVSLLVRNINGGLKPGVVVYGLSDVTIVDNNAVKGAGATSPYMVSNGKNHHIYYTAPMLDVGFATEVYKDEVSSVSSAPSIVIGEGRHEDNSTIVRVLNEQQICTAQFLAFPSKVKGGVSVAAGHTEINNNDVTLIATAAGGAYCDEARTVRVFDCNGMLYMEIVPEFYKKAPYSIACGNFVENDKNEYLFVMGSDVSDGTLKAAIYSLADGKVVKNLTYKVGKEHNGKTAYASIRHNSDKSDSVIVFIKGFTYKKDQEDVIPEYSDKHAVFEADASGNCIKADIKIPNDAASVCESAYESEKYIITVNGSVNDQYSACVYSYGYDSKEGTVINVGDYEDGFYWNVDDEYHELNKVDKNSEKYIRYAELIEIIGDAYADGQDDSILESAERAFWSVKLSKYDLIPIRDTYREIAEKYRGNPESFVAVNIFDDYNIFSDIFSELNESEIQVKFEKYLLGLYGNQLNVDKIFENDDGTLLEDHRCAFAELIVMERVIRLYSEALLAGIPPEIITANIYDMFVYSIDTESGKQTEYGAISDSLVFSTGLPFSTNKFGLWYNEPHNAFDLALSSGFKNTSILRYSTETDDFDFTFYQLLHMLRNGCRYIGIEGGKLDYIAAEINALNTLNDFDEARSGYAGGTGRVVAVDVDGKPYNIICLGGISNGLLKSIYQNGTMEGSVYSVPLKSKVVVESLSIRENPRYEKEKHNIKYINAGSQIEFTGRFAYQGEGDAYLKINVYNGECLIDSASVSYRLSSEKEYYRYVFKNQTDIEELSLEIEFVCEDYSSYKISDVDITLQKQDVANPSFGDYSGTSSYGGVSIDILDRNAVYNN